MKRNIIIAVLAAGVAMTMQGYSSVIINPTGWSNDGGSIDYDFDKTIDSSGLSAALNTYDAVPGTLPTHEIPGSFEGGAGGDFSDNAGRFTSLAGGTATLTYDLGATYELDSLLLWNGAETWNGNFYNTRGLASATMSFSTDGVTFTDAMAINPAQVADGYAPLTAEVYGIANIDARYVQFSGLSNHGGTDAHTGISEVKFTSTIPEPATLGLVALFGGGIVFARRRLMI